MQDYIAVVHWLIFHPDNTCSFTCYLWQQSMATKLDNVPKCSYVCAGEPACCSCHLSNAMSAGPAAMAECGWLLQLLCQVSNASLVAGPKGYLWAAHIGSRCLQLCSQLC